MFPHSVHHNEGQDVPKFLSGSKGGFAKLFWDILIPHNVISDDGTNSGFGYLTILGDGNVNISDHMNHSLTASIMDVSIRLMKTVKCKCIDQSKE